MSAIAAFILLPKRALPKLQSVLSTAGRDWRAGEAAYRYMQGHGREVGNFRASGWVLSTALMYLGEHGVGLETAYSEIVDGLSAAGFTYALIWDAATRERYLPMVAEETFDAAGLGQYYNAFNEVDEPGVGLAMLEGVRAIRRSLEALDENAVVILTIG
jgi:hypothetical protein